MGEKTKFWSFEFTQIGIPHRDVLLGPSSHVYIVYELSESQHENTEVIILILLRGQAAAQSRRGTGGSRPSCRCVARS